MDGRAPGDVKTVGWEGRGRFRRHLRGWDQWDLLLHWDEGCEGLGEEDVRPAPGLDNWVDGGATYGVGSDL